MSCACSRMLGKPLPPTVERGLGVGTVAAAGQVQHADRGAQPLGARLQLPQAQRPDDRRRGAREERRRAARRCATSAASRTTSCATSWSSWDCCSRRTTTATRAPAALPLGRAPSRPGGSEDGEDLSPLGAALIEALREAGEDPSELIKRKERDE